jgi:hypothetical protein
MKDVERVFKGRILAFIGCFGYLVEIFRIGCSLVSLMRCFPPKCKMVPWV